MLHKNRVMLSLASAAALLALAQCPTWAAEPGAQATDAAPSAELIRGARQWENNCARCHNMRQPDEFRPDQWKVIVTHMRVRAGLTGDQAQAIMTFLQNAAVSSHRTAATAAQSGGGLPVGTADIVHGRQVFNGTCVACHRADGTGAMPGVLDLTDPHGPLAKSDAVLFERIMNGYQTPGAPMAMPPKGGNPSLTPQDIRDVLAYIRTEFGTARR